MHRRATRLLVKRYYLYNIVDDEEPGKISLTKQTEPFGRESIALHNRSGDVYFKKGCLMMLSSSIEMLLRLIQSVQRLYIILRFLSL